jgi:hypothetical protein
MNDNKLTFGNPELNSGMQNPYTYSYISSNIPYNFTYYNSESTDASSVYSGLGDIQKRYRYQLWGSGNGMKAEGRYSFLRSNESIDYISKTITKRLQGVHPDGKNIILPNVTINSVIDSFYENNPNTSGQVLQEMVINHIVNSIRTEFDTIQTNNKLSIWVQRYDTQTGLKRVPDIKLNNKTRKPMFQMRY